MNSEDNEYEFIEDQVTSDSNEDLTKKSSKVIAKYRVLYISGKENGK